MQAILLHDGQLGSCYTGSHARLHQPENAITEGMPFELG